MAMNDDTIKFTIFAYSDKTCTNVENACDTDTTDMTDSKRGDVCCTECSVFCLPITFIIDIITCPFRGCIYLYNK